MKLYPTKAMWAHFKANITPLMVVSALADVLGGFHISYSARELLEDLGLLTRSGAVNKNGRLALSAHLHYEYHKSTEPLIIVSPYDIGENSESRRKTK